MSTNPVDIVNEFFAQWGKTWEDMSAAYRNTIADDITWVQPGIPDVNSLDEAVGLLNSLHEGAGVETIEIIMTRIAADGNLVFTERVDHMRRADGTIVLSADVVGVMELNDEGKICWWREYFDPRDVLALMGG